MNIIQPVILSGGSGTRLWPLSRELYPKQLLPLVNNHTLLQETLLRVYTEKNRSGAFTNKPIIVCNNEHRFLVAEQLRQVDIHESQIILEPVGRNTAPALTLAALYSEDDPVLLVMPADHVISNHEVLESAIETGYQLAQQAALVTFGIVPHQPEVSYGYIRRGEALGNSEFLESGNQPYALAGFVEKPDLPTATEYVSSGNYLWNSGMFMMKASTWLKEMEKYRPDILQACQQAYEGGKKDLDFYRVDEAAFTQCPSDSIDYAVMERSTTEAVSLVEKHNAVFGVVVPLDAGWSDVGAWSALWEVGQQDDDGNVLKGDVKAYNTKNSFMHAEHRFVAGVGIEDLVVVETADAVLVANKAQAQDVKQIVEWLKEQQRDERLVHRQVFRPWGSYEGVVAGERFQVKRIIVNPGASLSLQMHHHRAEHWIVVKGTAKVTCGTDITLLSENESTYIPLGTKHRLENPGRVPLEIIEVQSGSYLGEDDIVRFEDDYGRSHSDSKM
ncbi:MAG: mannose-1-phosphate guanylyltransferase/mannose-6-phosphate isomerase [Gammaproteobacteria bacterium]|nr:mannose-1-phosphate guanylyltransferase/mannose-6-phosphate isomerase [Gammaproteobacteria bacterium]